MGSVLWVLGIGGGVIGALVLVNLLRRRPPRSGPAVENPDVGALPQAVAYAGLVAAALQVFAAASLEEVAFAAFAAWVVLTTVAMFRSRVD